ncbi:MAG: hypothetical protein RBU25_06005, partial [Lentisphaeria bacterium]|nr:hypothetical protein [Lentisphaeria bacterium]
DRCLLQLFGQGRIDEQTARLRLRSRDSLARLDKLKEQRAAAPPPPPPPPVSETNSTRRYL